MKQIKKRTSAGISIFIDLLGFGKKVVDADSFEDIKELVNSLEIVREAFDYNQKGEISSTEEKRYALSDSVITFIPLQSKAMQCSNCFDVLLNEISTLAYNQMICIQNGIFVRGGISLGWFYEDGNNFISDALTQAVSIEKKIWAPVIGISQHTVQYFLDREERKFYSKESDPMNNGTFEKTKIGKSEFYYLNYLKLAIEATSPPITSEFKALLRSEEKGSQQKINEAYWAAQANLLLIHKEKILEATKNITDEYVLKKYKWLAKYHNSFAKNFKKVNPSVMLKIS